MGRKIGLRVNCKAGYVSADFFLSGENNKKPKDIRNFSIEYKADKMPTIQTAEIVLGPMLNVAKVIEPKKKWRNRRNEIAHKATMFKNKALFVQYKGDVLMAVDEFRASIIKAL